MILVTLLLFTGMDMIGELPNRTPVTAPVQVVSSVPQGVTPKDKDKPEVGRKEIPPVETTVKPQVVKPKEVKKREEPANSGGAEKPVEETKPVKETKPVEEAKPVEETKPVKETKPVEETKPVKETKPVEEPKPVESNKDVTVSKEQNEALHYYVYTSKHCAHCTSLINELKKHVAEEVITVSEDNKTKSGKAVSFVPVLEIYKGDKLIHYHVGYESWDTIEGALNETD